MTEEGRVCDTMHCYIKHYKEEPIAKQKLIDSKSVHKKALVCPRI